MKDLSADVKQNEIKELEAVSWNFLKGYPTFKIWNAIGKTGMYFLYLIFLAIPSSLILSR